MASVAATQTLRAQGAAPADAAALEKAMAAVAREIEQIKVIQLRTRAAHPQTHLPYPYPFFPRRPTSLLIMPLARSFLNRPNCTRR